MSPPTYYDDYEVESPPPGRGGAPEGAYYKIERGDTLYSIARKHNVRWHEIIEANPSLDPRDLRVGRVILVPGVAPVEGPAPVEPPPDAGTPRVHPGHPGPIPAERHYAWPLRGKVLAYYGQSVPWRTWVTNHGIDIRAGVGQAVTAAKSGRVSTFTTVPGFGKTVVLEHTDGAVTFYGHLDRILVRHGRWARQGEELGIAGSTGASSGTELHFRIMRTDGYINPMLYLPR